MLAVTGTAHTGRPFAGFAALAWMEELVSGQPNGIGDAVDALLGKAPWLSAGCTVAALLLRFAGGAAPHRLPKQSFGSDAQATRITVESSVVA
jgi:hypothetical protein